MSGGIEQAVAEIMAARPTFRDGDRVRLRLSGECQAQPEKAALQGQQGEMGEPVEWDGLTGIVDTSSHHQSRIEGHDVHILFDDPPWYHGRRITGEYFAPTELELLEPASAADTTGDDDASNM